MATIRAFLIGDADEGARLATRFAEKGEVKGYSELVYAAFAIAARRRFSPTWTVAQIVRFVTDTRMTLLQDGLDIDPCTAETLIRRVLGDGIDVRLEEEASARAQIFLLLTLIDDEGLDDAGIDAFLVQARSLADQLVDRAGRQDSVTAPAGGASEGQVPGFDKT